MVANTKEKEKVFISDKDELTELNPKNFIPYACHYNTHTTLTKNGELIHTIKIPGFTNNTPDKSQDLRKDIVQAILDTDNFSSFAFWVHTVRKKWKAPEGTKNKNGLCEQISLEWLNRLSKNNFYYNEIYISIISEAPRDNFLDPRIFMRRFFAFLEYKFTTRYLQSSLFKLNKVTKSLENKLQPYGAKLIGMYHRENENGKIFYSEIMSFYNRIINLQEKPYPTNILGISEDLTQNRKYTFGFDTVTIEDNDHLSFATIFSIKDHPKISPRYVDDILQLPMEFLITESFTFGLPKKNQKQFLEKHRKLRSLHESEVLLKAVSSEIYTNLEEKSSEDFCEHQVTLQIHSDNKETLEEDASILIQAYRNIGIAIIREDINLTNCYWAQLPANFASKTRRTHIPSLSLCGLSSIRSFPIGNIKDKKWGEYISIFNNPVDRSPFFFTPHTEKNGHTIITGPVKSGKSSLLNLLLSQAKKISPSILYLEAGRNNELFIRSVEGNYSVLENNNSEDLKLPINKGEISGYSFSNLLADKGACSEYIFQIIAKFNSLLSGHPAIIVLDELLRVSISLLSPDKLIELFNNISSNNGIIIFVESDLLLDKSKDELIKTLIDNISTKIIIPILR